MGDLPREDKHPIKLWGRSTFEILSMIRASEKRPLLLENSYQVVVPSPAVPAILDKLDSVHNGKPRAMYLAARSYWWLSFKAVYMAQSCWGAFQTRSGRRGHPQLPLTSFVLRVPQQPRTLLTTIPDGITAPRRPSSWRFGLVGGP